MKRKSEQKHFTSRSLKTESRDLRKTSLKTDWETVSGEPTQNSFERDRERKREI